MRIVWSTLLIVGLALVVYSVTEPEQPTQSSPPSYDDGGAGFPPPPPPAESKL
jgi:hypothetical protein